MIRHVTISAVCHTSRPLKRLSRLSGFWPGPSGSPFWSMSEGGLLGGGKDRGVLRCVESGGPFVPSESRRLDGASVQLVPRKRVQRAPRTSKPHVVSSLVEASQHLPSLATRLESV